MGTGASATLAETAKTISDDELKAAFKNVSAADRMRIAAAAVDGIDQYGAVADGGGVESPGLPEAPADWIKECLDCHNKFRANHGVPALEWSHECYEFALLQAETCQANGKISHGNQAGPSGFHGQNTYGCSEPDPACNAVQSWYNEIKDPGYDFQSPGPKPGVNHFTQVVWKGTTKVGMAKSKDGRFIVANYFPGGNITNEGYYKENIPAPKVEMWAKLSAVEVVESKSKPQVMDANFDATAECSKSAVTATSMTPEMETALKGCPFKDYLEDVKKAFEQKGKVTVDRQGNDVKIVIEVGDMINELNGSW